MSVPVDAATYGLAMLVLSQAQLSQDLALGRKVPAAWRVRPPCADYLIIDYLQLIVGGGRIDNRVQEMGAISRSIKGMARDFDIPVVACSQLSRAIEQRPNHRPLLSDL